MQSLIDRLKAELTGYHIEIHIHPSGGMIDASGCDECGTDESEYKSAGWSLKKHKNKTIDDAVNELKTKLGLVT